MINVNNIIQGLDICTTPVKPSECEASCMKCHYYENGNKLNCIPTLLLDALELIKKQKEQIAMMKMVYGDPGEIVGKIVRCKNCKHCDSERIDKNMIWCKIHQFGRPDDYYCADGIEK